MELELRVLAWWFSGAALSTEDTQIHAGPHRPVFIHADPWGSLVLFPVEHLMTEVT